MGNVLPGKDQERERDSFFQDTTSLRLCSGRLKVTRGVVKDITEPGFSITQPCPFPLHRCGNILCSCKGFYRKLVENNREFHVFKLIKM